MKFLSILSFLFISFSAFAVQANLHQAAWWNKDSEAIQRLLDKGVDVNSKDKYGNTALMHAAEDGDIEMVQLLLRRGADMHIKNSINETALNYAILRYNIASKKEFEENEGKYIKVIKLLSKTKSIDAIMKSMTFNLNWTEENMRRTKKVMSLIQAIQPLLDKGVDINQSKYEEERAVLRLRHVIEGYRFVSKKEFEENEEKYTDLIKLLLTKTKNTDAIMKSMTVLSNESEEAIRRTKKIMLVLQKNAK